MNSTLSKVFIFVAGAAVGSVATWKFVETKYARMAREEVEAVRALYKAEKGEEEVESEPEPKVEEKPMVDKASLSDYADILKETEYTNYSDSEIEVIVGDIKVKKPYVISPDDFGDNDQYDTETLYYFADKVLADDMDNPIEDVEAMVGSESLTQFGQYEDDCVHVRNDRYKTDYEIILDARRFDEVAKSKLHPTED